MLSVLAPGTRFSLTDAACWFPDDERPDNLLFVRADDLEAIFRGPVLSICLVPALAAPLPGSAVPAWRPGKPVNRPGSLTNASACRLLVNPAWAIDPARGRAVAPDGRSRPLSRPEIEAVYFGRRGFAVADIAGMAQTAPEATVAAVDSLASEGIVLAGCWSSALARLHAWWATGRLHVSRRRATLADLWDRRLRLSPHRPALIGGDGARLTFAELDRRARALMGWFVERGLRKGDRVAVWAEPFLDLSAVFWAVARSGLVLMPVFPGTPATGVAGLLGELKPKVLVADTARHAGLDDPGEAIRLAVDAAGPDDAGDGVEFLGDILGRSPSPLAPGVQVVADDPVLLIMTSGTTGASKKLFKTHGACFADLAHHACAIGATADDVFLASDALVNQTSMRGAFGVPAYCGGATALAPQPGPTQVIEVWERMADAGVTVLVTLPSVLRHAVALAARGLLPEAGALRAIHTTGAPIGEDLASQAMRAFGVEVVDSYAASETGLVAARSSRWPARRLAGLSPLGTAWDCVVRIGDPDRVAASGALDSIWVLSDALAVGYLRDGHAVDGRLRQHGWYDTGDLGLRDADGGVHVAGRRDGSIKLASGQLVVPGSIETVLQEHPAVASAVVLPTVDRLGGEAIAALVEVDGSPDRSSRLANAIRAHVRDRLGPAFRIERVEFLDRLPKTRTGKVDRRQVAGMLSAAGSD